MSDVTDELRAELTALDWRIEGKSKDTGVGWYAWKRLEGAADCVCNDKPPSLIITPYEVAVHGKTWRSAEFEVTGEVANGRWLKLKAYSVQIDEVIDAIPECSLLLRSAWNAVATKGAAGQGEPK